MMKVFDLSGRGLYDLSDIDIPDDVTHLDITNNLITSLDGLKLPQSLIEFNCSTNKKVLRV
jgi:Leucine-rich repeat (LRR) protein